jgi:hypothetical protein
MKTKLFLNFLLPFFLIGILSLGYSQAPASKTKQKTTPTKNAAVSDTLNIKDYYLELRANVRQLKGDVKDESKPLDSALITIYEGEIPTSEIWTNKKGKCTFRLPLGKNFKIDISKNNYVTKSISVSTKMPEDKKDVFSFSFDVDIFEKVKRLDVSVLEKPIAKVTYNLSLEGFAYDMNYTNRVNLDLKKMYKNYYMLEKVDADSLDKPAISPNGKTKASIKK